MRLYKYIKVNANKTQSEVIQLFETKRIKVNNNYVPFTYLIKENDIVTIDDDIIKSKKLQYFLYNKPKGIISDIKNKDNSYINYIDLDIKLMPCGRLDKDSEGLMILTNDGKFINDVLSNKTEYEKEYIVTVEKKIDDSFIENIKKPIIIKNKMTLPIKAYKIDDYTINMILQDGRYHQIRRIIKNASNKVLNLQRIRIGPYTLGDLKLGEIREIKR